MDKEQGMLSGSQQAKRDRKAVKKKKRVDKYEYDVYFEGENKKQYSVQIMSLDDEIASKRRQSAGHKDKIVKCTVLRKL